MITRMSHVLVWVKNQQEALEFYRDKLGFEVDTDAKIGEDYRWLTMKIRTQPGFEIILMEPKAGMMLDEESGGAIALARRQRRARRWCLRSRRHLQNVRRTESAWRRIQGTANGTRLGHCHGDDG